MKLNQLKALLAIARAGSIQEASRLMNVTQPALSKSIIELERELGVPLLIRAAKGATLSSYGTMIAKRSRAIQKEVEKIYEEVDALRGEQSGKVTIGLSPPVGGVVAAEAVSAFRKQRPSTLMHLLELRPSQIADGLRDGTLDLGIVSHYGEAGPSGLKWVKLYSTETMLAVGGKRPHASVSIEELGAMEWLVTDAPDDAFSYMGTLFSRFNMPPPTQVLHCSSVTLYFQLAKRLNAVSSWGDMAFPALREQFRLGLMSPLDLNVDMPRMNVFLAYQDEDLLTPAASAYIKCLHTAVSKQRKATQR